MSVARKTIGTVLTIVMIASAAPVALGQLHPPEVKGLRGASFPSMNPPPDVRSYGDGPAWDGKPPDGVQPLLSDMFTSKDFYKDRALWMDKRYYRCNSPRQITDMRSGGAGQSTADPRIGSNPPVSARWGDCNMDWPRENIVSPYSFKTGNTTRRCSPMPNLEGDRPGIPMQQCRNGTARTASMFRTAGACGTIGEPTRSRRYCRC